MQAAPGLPPLSSFTAVHMTPVLLALTGNPPPSVPPAREWDNPSPWSFSSLLPAKTKGSFSGFCCHSLCWQTRGDKNSQYGESAKSAAFHKTPVNCYQEHWLPDTRNSWIEVTAVSKFLQSLLFKTHSESPSKFPRGPWDGKGWFIPQEGLLLPSEDPIQVDSHCVHCLQKTFVFPVLEMWRLTTLCLWTTYIFGCFLHIQYI